MGYNAPEHALLPEGFNWKDTEAFDEANTKLTDELRPGRSTSTSPRTTAPSTAPAATTRPVVHCQAKDPNGKLDIVKRAGTGSRRGRRSPAPALPAHLLGRLHVPELGDDESPDVERHFWKR